MTADGTGRKGKQLGLMWVEDLEPYRSHYDFYRDQPLHGVYGDFLEEDPFEDPNPEVGPEYIGYLTIFDSIHWMRWQQEVSGVRYRLNERMTEELLKEKGEYLIAARMADDQGTRFGKPPPENWLNEWRETARREGRRLQEPEPENVPDSQDAYTAG